MEVKLVTEMWIADCYRCLMTDGGGSSTATVRLESGVRDSKIRTLILEEETLGN